MTRQEFIVRHEHADVITLFNDGSMIADYAYWYHKDGKVYRKPYSDLWVPDPPIAVRLRVVTQLRPPYRI